MGTVLPVSFFCVTSETVLAVSFCDRENRPRCHEIDTFSTSIYTSSICQSIGVRPFFSKNSFVFEKGLEPKKPR